MLDSFKTDLLDIFSAASDLLLTDDEIKAQIREKIADQQSILTIKFAGLNEQLQQEIKALIDQEHAELQQTVARLLLEQLKDEKLVQERQLFLQSLGDQALVELKAFWQQLTGQKDKQFMTSLVEQLKGHLTQLVQSGTDLDTIKRELDQLLRAKTLTNAVTFPANLNIQASDLFCGHCKKYLFHLTPFNVLPSPFTDQDSQLKLDYDLVTVISVNTIIARLNKLYLVEFKRNKKGQWKARFINERYRGYGEESFRYCQNILPLSTNRFVVLYDDGTKKYLRVWFRKKQQPKPWYAQPRFELSQDFGGLIGSITNRVVYWKLDEKAKPIIVIFNPDELKLDQQIIYQIATSQIDVDDTNPACFMREIDNDIILFTIADHMIYGINLHQTPQKTVCELMSNLSPTEFIIVYHSTPNQNELFVVEENSGAIYLLNRQTTNTNHHWLETRLAVNAGFKDQAGHFHRFEDTVLNIIEYQSPILRVATNKNVIDLIVGHELSELRAVQLTPNFPELVEDVIILDNGELLVIGKKQLYTTVVNFGCDCSKS